MAEIEEFLTDHSMTAAGFGKLALGDPNFVKECREGRSPRLDTVFVVLEFMRKYRPNKRRSAA
jgi:hypothetical protein